MTPEEEEVYDPERALRERFPDDFGDHPRGIDPLAAITLANDARPRRKGVGFAVTTNAKNPSASWNELGEMKLVLSPILRMSLKSSRKTRSKAS